MQQPSYKISSSKGVTLDFSSKSSVTIGQSPLLVASKLCVTPPSPPSIDVALRILLSTKLLWRLRLLQVVIRRSASRVSTQRNIAFNLKLPTFKTTCRPSNNAISASRTLALPPRSLGHFHPRHSRVRYTTISRLLPPVRNLKKNVSFFKVVPKRISWCSSTFRTKSTSIFFFFNVEIKS